MSRTTIVTVRCACLRFVAGPSPERYSSRRRASQDCSTTAKRENCAARHVLVEAVAAGLEPDRTGLGRGAGQTRASQPVRRRRLGRRRRRPLVRQRHIQRRVQPGERVRTRLRPGRASSAARARPQRTSRPESQVQYCYRRPSTRLDRERSVVFFDKKKKIQIKIEKKKSSPVRKPRVDVPCTMFKVRYLKTIVEENVEKRASVMAMEIKSKPIKIAC